MDSTLQRLRAVCAARPTARGTPVVSKRVFLHELVVFRQCIMTVSRCCVANATPKSARSELNTATSTSARGSTRLGLQTPNNDQNQINFDTENESEQPTKPLL